MSAPKISTLKELKASQYKPTSIKQELRRNLIKSIKAKGNPFDGIWGYENTVIPQIERAILSKHNIILLGLRGQAKTKIARLMVNLLDEWMPVVSGSEINDDPLNPISRYAFDKIAEHGLETPISWVHRSDRYYEKLATPDVTIADLIGDIDPIKAANMRLSYADDRVIHFGMIPRANRSIFVINELPDLQPRIQVALFNILQEGDMQIRGFKLRLNPDLQFLFTANPEDYTNRGSIITPLKDRIGSQILTHYPDSLETASKITFQEAKLDDNQLDNVEVPHVARMLIEQIGVEARDSEYIDEKSGVSARMGITILENLMSSVERRMLMNNEKSSTVRLHDFLGAIPSITGKVELVYEGEQEGAGLVAEHLLGKAVKTLFTKEFPDIADLKRTDEQNPYQDILDFFATGNSIEMFEDYSDKEYKSDLSKLAELKDFVMKHKDNALVNELNFYSEMLLWTLAENSKLDKSKVLNKITYTDLFNSYLRDSLKN
jgi:magnesium chelatase subunit I